MKKVTTLIAGIAAGLATGALVYRERASRRAAERMSAASLETLLNAIDANDAQTGGHVRRVAAFALCLADAAGFDDDCMRTIERVALFHDIGKIHEALFDVVHDSAALSPSERKAMLTHPQKGADVLAPLKGFYPDLTAGVLSHHECWNGSGYPRGLRGRRIPVAARIVALADTFDAITHTRRYRGGRSAEQAFQAIAECRGTQFDPELVDLMLSPPVRERIVRIFRNAPMPKVREAAGRETMVPNVKFRWRSKTVDPDAERLGGAR